MLQLPTINLKQSQLQKSLNKPKSSLKKLSWLVRAGLCFVLSGFLIFCQAQIFNAFEAHVINVTARICKHSETRTMGYWKNHPNVYAYYLPQYLGSDPIISIDDADEIFKKANAREMADMLRAQLLAMKFNIAHFGIGGYFVESAGMTLDEIAAAADQLLIDGGTRKQLENIKDLLDELNNLHQIKYCGPSDSEPELEPEPDPEPDDQCLKINEVYYDPDTNHGTANDEWLELYNVCLRKINLQNWTLKDNSSSQETISQDLVLESEQFAVLFAASSTLAYWPDIPDSTLKISLGGTKLFNGLSNTGDHLVLYTPDDLEADAVSWGTDATAFDPAVADADKGHSIARIVKGQDTDTALDWQDLALPNPGTNPHNNLLDATAQLNVNLNAALDDLGNSSENPPLEPEPDNQAEDLSSENSLEEPDIDQPVDQLKQTEDLVQNPEEVSKSDQLPDADQTLTETTAEDEAELIDDIEDETITETTDADSELDPDQSELSQTNLDTKTDLDTETLKTNETDSSAVQEPEDLTDQIAFFEELPAPELDNQTLNTSNIKPENSNEELVNEQESDQEEFE